MKIEQMISENGNIYYRIKIKNNKYKCSFYQDLEDEDADYWLEDESGNFLS